MLKIPFAACPCLSQLISAQFAFEMCLTARTRQKIHRKLYFGIQDYPRSLILMPIESRCMVIYSNLGPISHSF